MICSAYRDHATQVMLYDRKVEEYEQMDYTHQEAEKEARNWVAVPGNSEHETGHALDIVSEAYQG